MVAILNDLEHEGYVSRDRDRTDRHRNSVTLTGAGRSALSRFDLAIAEAQDAVLASFSPADREKLSATSATAQVSSLGVQEGSASMRYPPVHVPPLSCEVAQVAEVADTPPDGGKYTLSGVDERGEVDAVAKVTGYVMKFPGCTAADLRRCGGGTAAKIAYGPETALARGLIHIRHDGRAMRHYPGSGR